MERKMLVMRTWVMRWAQRPVDCMRLPVEWHVRDGNMAFEGSVSCCVTIKSVGVLNFLVEKCAEHMRNGRVGKIGSEHAAGVFKI